MSKADDKKTKNSLLQLKDLQEKKIVIEGVTQQGQTFRPSDWAERMSGTLATFKNRRIYYSPMLQPTTHVEGYKCILLDPKLKESSPEVYQSILDFAKANHLRICNEDRSPEDESS
ncbi:MAG: DUF3579 domain-containing protein [Legionella sp.]|nr:DUF3579 domain-containing protein [Legionella sp.]